MAKSIKPRASALKSHIGYHLRVVSNAVSHSFARKLASNDVTVAEWVVLREMYAGNDTTSPATIAHSTGLTRGAISKLVERLVNKKLVTRTESKGDRRYQDIKLTSHAIKLVPKLAGIADENDRFFFSALSKSEKEHLRNLLLKLTDAHTLTENPVE